MTITLHPPHVAWLGYLVAVLFLLAYVRLNERRRRLRQYLWSCLILGSILLDIARRHSDITSCIVFAGFVLFGLVGLIRTRIRKPKLKRDAMGEVEDSIENLAAKVASNLGVDVEVVKAEMEQAAENQARRDMLIAERRAAGK